MVFLNRNSIEEIRLNLLSWFALKGRHWIPWKLNENGVLPNDQEHLSIYPIFVAEVMLQQTQLKVVLPYWEQWMRTFPTLEDLASAELNQVLFLWSGLGYYSRAKRLHQASQILLKSIGKNQTLDLSRWPQDVNTWIRLPGIGRSTAGSILSSALNLPTPLLDANVKRILSRLIGSNKPVSKNLSQLWEISALLLDKQSPRNFNQALMDLGANVCSNSSPKCTSCPLISYCYAYSFGSPVDFPNKERRKKVQKVCIGIGVIINKVGQVLIDKRPDDVSMGGMWEFPGGKQEHDELIENTIFRELNEELGIKVKVGDMLISFDHSYTHKNLTFVVHFCEILSGNLQPLRSSELQWVEIQDLDNYAFPAANKKMINALKQYLKNNEN